MSEIENVIANLERQKAAIDSALLALREVSGMSASATPASAGTASSQPGTGRRPMSAEGRRRIAAATKKRWADKRAAEAGGKPAATKKAVKKGSAKRHVSAESRKRMAEAQKKRWAAKKAA